MMVRSQTRPPDAPPPVATPEAEPLSGSILMAVFNSLWKKEEPAAAPVVVEEPPTLPPSAMVYTPPAVNVTVHVPRPLLYAILAVQAVILCLQVAHLVSP